MKKIFFVVFIFLSFNTLVLSTVNVESETGLNVYHDGTCERAGSLKFIIFNSTDFQSASPTNSVFIKVQLTDGAVLCRDLDGNNAPADGVNWVGVETDGTINGFTYGDVLIRGAQGQDYIEVMIYNAPGNGINLPNSTNQAWFSFGSTLDFLGNNFTVNVYDYSSPTTVIRTLDFGTPLCIDYSGRVNGEDLFLPNEINYVVLESYQGAINGQPLGVGFSPANPPIAFGSAFSPNINYISAASNEFGTISPNGEIPVENGANKEFLFIPTVGYHLKRIVVDGASIGISSTYTFYSVTENHTIYGDFAENNPPVINSFSSDTTSGNKPATIIFTVNAVNPKGGSIIQYNWDLNGDGNIDRSTNINSISHIYSSAGIYYASVTVIDDELESTTSEPIVINVSNEFKYLIGKELVNSNLVCVNPFPDGGNIVVKGLNSEGTTILEKNYPIFCNGKLSIHLSDIITESVENFEISADRKIIFFIDGIYENGKFASYMFNDKYRELPIPHVAEEVDNWNTFLFLSNIYKSQLRLNTGEIDNELTPTFFFNCNLNYYFQENSNNNSWFGNLKTYSNNPFSNTYSLSGFEYFAYKNGDGASVELSGNLSTKFYIPHLTTNNEIFWTGLAFTNSTNNEITLNAEFYLNSGESSGSEELIIPANTKIKGTASELFSNIQNTGNWGIIQTTGKIQAIEIYGTYSAGICGFPLQNKLITNGIFPLMLKGENNWTGLAICNPNNETTYVEFSLISATGQLKTTVSDSILPFGKFSKTVEELFSELAVTGDYITVSSTLPITGLTATGDLSRTFMKALNVTEK